MEIRTRELKKWTRRCVAATCAALMAVGPGLMQASAGTSPNDAATTTPIKHVILIIGENRSFDHVFGTFRPVKGQTVWNLRSEGIVNADGSPGPNFDQAKQYKAEDYVSYSISPKKIGPYATLVPPNTGGAPTSPFFNNIATAESVEPALPLGAYDLLLTGGTGLPNGVVDTRFSSGLQDGPFDISKYISYNDYAGSPVHRFFQMWQQLDCNISAATPDNPSGCQADLFPWVEVTIGAGNNGVAKPSPFTNESTHEGSISMGFYNSAEGDMSYFTHLAHQYALSDNYHQAIMGGTGANHIAIGYGTTMFYANPDGSPGTPPSNQIENPNPQPHTNNWYTQDGYGGGSYVNCADDSQPGIGNVDAYLKALPYQVLSASCETKEYYLVNNYNPGYFGDGTPAPLGPTDFTIPPSTQPNIGTLLNQHDVSWKYYGEGWQGGKENSVYCNICNPFLYSTQIMTSATQRAAHLGGIEALYSDIQGGTLPAVSIVKPDGYLDGHPSSSKFDLFEAFCKKIIDMTKANPGIWKDTAIVITVDEGGGYYDSGYVQPVDFFGDGTRIPMLVVSPYSKGGRVVHAYYDHVSFDKFVEANWSLGPISARSRDNLPNPTTASNPYIPTNSPAIGDLMDMFVFP